MSETQGCTHLSLGSTLGEGACFASIEELLRIHVTEHLDQLRDHPGPSRLVAGSQARPVIAVEIFVE